MTKILPSERAVGNCLIFYGTSYKHSKWLAIGSFKGQGHLFAAISCSSSLQPLTSLNLHHSLPHPHNHFTNPTFTEPAQKADSLSKHKFVFWLWLWPESPKSLKCHLTSSQIPDLILTSTLGRLPEPIQIFWHFPGGWVGRSWRFSWFVLGIWQPQGMF